MADDLPQALAEAPRALVEAPAGCGKTHLIAAATSRCSGRQLVLTHTHAGVRSLREKLTFLRVPPERYHVSTLASFGLRYASAFPTLSGWNRPEPEGDEWSAVLPAAVKALCARAVEQVLRASYTGIFVDEYQDCTKAQHQLVTHLASALPCRVLGDPLQSVFAEVNEGEALPWSEAERAFPRVGTLGVPYRWRGRNEALGYWLLDVRSALLKGHSIDIAGEKSVTFASSENAPEVPLAECKRLLPLYPSTAVVIRRYRAQCHKLAGTVPNFTVFEDANGVDLLHWARRIDESSGAGRVQVVAEFADKWLCGHPRAAIGPVVSAAVKGESCRAKRTDLLALSAALHRLREADALASIPVVLDAYMALKESPVFTSRETWMGLHSAVRQARTDSSTPLRDAVWRQRDRLRRGGRCPPVRCLGTPLLVKGLEFDHALILNSAEFPDVEGLYVALTRASRSLTVVGWSSILPYTTAKF